MAERDAKANLGAAGPPEPAVKLGAKDAKAQAEEIQSETPKIATLDCTKDGNIKATLANCELILCGDVKSDSFVGRNEFAANDFYLADTPWR